MTSQRLSDLSLPRTTLSATLVLVDGESRDGLIFLIPRTSHHFGGETPLEMLHRPEPVFPFKTDDGKVLLIVKAQTIRLSTDEGDRLSDAQRPSVGRTVRLEVALDDGFSISGTVTMEVPEARSRLLDYLNDLPDPFFTVVDGGTMHFVNRDHVLYVRPLEK